MGFGFGLGVDCICDPAVKEGYNYVKWIGVIFGNETI